MIIADAQARLDRAEEWLWKSGIIFLIAFTIHCSDHMRRGQDSITETLWNTGFVTSMFSVAVVTLVLTRHRLGALGAALIILPQAFAFTAVHLFPPWSALSDSFTHHGGSSFSWAAIIGQILGAALLGAAGVLVLITRKQARGGYFAPASGA